MKIKVLFWFIIGFNTILSAGNNEHIKKRCINLVKNGALLLYDETGSPLLLYNAEKPFIPASILKILTAQIALEVLQETYRFKTEFYHDSKQNMIIKGLGDPYLISEEIASIAAHIKKMGIDYIEQLFLDNSHFVSPIVIPGTSKTLNPYDAINEALVVNFNTINIKKDSRGVVFSGEEETPLTPLARKKGILISKGSTQRINLSKNIKECMQYTGELFNAFFRDAGITVKNTTIGTKKISEEHTLLYTHFNSRPLPFILEGLLCYSNNFIANQLLLTIAHEKNGTPVTLKNATEFFNHYCTAGLSIPREWIHVYEGSGISRNNKITGKAMAMILERFKPHARLLTSKNGAYTKSGTLKNVYNYAGYIQTDRGLRSYVILLNQPSNNRDKILQYLINYNR